MPEYLLPELIYKCSRLVWKTNEKLLWRVLRFLLFTVRSWFFDVKYLSVSMEKLQEILNEYAKWLEETGLEYTSDYWDCDDYSISFKSFFTSKAKANSVGIALGMVCKDGKPLGGHAWNIALLDNGNLVFIEPQTREIMTGNISSDGYVYELQAVIW